MICICNNEGRCLACWSTDEVVFDSLLPPPKKAVPAPRLLSPEEIEACLERGRRNAKDVWRAARGLMPSHRSTLILR